jgi:anionic cell wall polymer biosynthesis LytR-Cps2A-Psr (LCP) family protein
MDGISKIADAVGGIDVTLDTTIPDVGKKGQTLTLKGQKAEDYLRDRHNTSGEDFGRTAHQRDFMILLAKKIKSMGAVEALSKLYDEFSEFGKTDMKLDHVLAFAKILNTIDIDSIELLSVPGTGKDNVVYHDESGTLDLLLKVYYTEVS